VNVNFTFKNFEPSEHLKRYARRRFEKILKFVSDKSDVTEVNVHMTVDKFRHRAEVNITSGQLQLSANEESEDMYSSIDLVLDKVEAQLRKMREKSKDHRRSGKGGKDKSVRMDYFSYAEGEAGNRERTIVRTDSYEPKPMDVDEAAMQLDNLDYEFLVFRNAETERVNVIYRRKNNDFGLIDPGT